MNPIKDKTDLSGMLGEVLAVRKVNGSVVIKNRPKRKVVADPSPAQAAAQERLTEAAKWAKQQMKKADVKALYATGIAGKKKSAFLVALTDYVTSPKVSAIDASLYKGAIGDPITAKATDDFAVTQVVFTITDATGKLLESGQAKQDADKSFQWNYVATVANPTVTGTKISVTAIDRPGNKGSLDSLLS
jgi:hypothetical protein